jgi:hypothetical protein
VGNSLFRFVGWGSFGDILYDLLANFFIHLALTFFNSVEAIFNSLPRKISFERFRVAEDGILQSKISRFLHWKKAENLYYKNRLK